MMASVAEARRSPFSPDPHHPHHPRNPRNPHHPHMHKSIPILPSTSSSTLAPPRDPMDITLTATSMGPPSSNSASLERNANSQNHAQSNGTMINGDVAATSPNGNAAPAVGAAAAAHQPKVVQTAFIHKLYNMLEDQSIQHLISWSSTNESFVMSPSSEFSKVLSSYFKHTNISSFVRQLNMYGFHKVSDVFHAGSPDSPLWEFKHGNGNFKRGDLVGLREIKRRASRHALIHRDSFPAPKLSTAPPTGQTVEPMPDPVESRLSVLEHSMYDMHARVQRSEEVNASLNQKVLVLMERLMRCHQWNHDLTSHIMAMVPDPENPIHRDVSMMQRDVSRQIDMLRAWEAPEESLPGRQALFMHLDSGNGPPLSPRQMPLDGRAESRRGSLAGMPRSAPYKPAVPSHIAVSPRRFSAIGGPNYSPSAARTPAQHQPPLPPPPTIQQPSPASNLALNPLNSSSPPYNLNRRHTSADIRNTPGWQNQPPASSALSPFASSNTSSQWPSSPNRAPTAGGEQQLREALESYQLSRAPHTHSSRQSTPPYSNDGPPAPLAAENSCSLPGTRYPFKGIDTSGSLTRRSSMASNVHSLLNAVSEDDPDEARKRKRMG